MLSLRSQIKTKVENEVNEENIRAYLNSNNEVSTVFRITDAIACLISVVSMSFMILACIVYKKSELEKSSATVDTIYNIGNEFDETDPFLDELFRKKC